MTDTVWGTIGAWSLGVIAVYAAVLLSATAIRAGGEFVEDLSDDMQTRLGAVLFGAFTVALVYATFWGCFLVGEAILNNLFG